MLTPKEKADELYVGFWYLTNDSRIAKNCALVAVDEIVEWNEFDVISDITNQRYIDRLNYLDEVKQEILKL
jgi:hypothetical protein